MKILSIDGGGVRGIIPSQILYRIENDLGINIYNTFDVFAGSSVGSMIIGALAYKQASGAQLMNVYMTPANVQIIMPQSRVQGKYAALIIFAIFLAIVLPSSFYYLYRGLWGSVFVFIISIILGGLFGFIILNNTPKYTGSGKTKTIENFVGTETKLSDTSKKVFIPTYDMSLKKPVFFRSYDFPTVSTDINTSQDSPSNTYLIADIINASSAAPGLYPAVQIKNDYYVDGSVATNNPTDCVYADILNMQTATAKEKNYILSLGCGYPTPILTSEKGIVNWGEIQWITSGDIGLFIGNEQSVDYRVKNISKAFGDVYLRIDGICDSKLDNTNIDNLTELVHIGDKWFEANKAALIDFFDLKPIQSK